MKQMGQEIKEGDTPPDISDMYYETQLAFNFYGYLPEKWEGMSGTYMGKDCTLLPYLFNLHGIAEDEQKYILTTIRKIDSETSISISKKQKAAQAQQKRSGK
jgi:hypothetical protein